jgi:hypothetical protein
MKERILGFISLISVKIKFSLGARHSSVFDKEEKAT